MAEFNEPKCQCTKCKTDVNPQTQGLAFRSNGNGKYKKDKWYFLCTDCFLASIKVPVRAKCYNDDEWRLIFNGIQASEEELESMKKIRNLLEKFKDVKIVKEK